MCIECNREGCKTRLCSVCLRKKEAKRKADYRLNSSDEWQIKRRKYYDDNKETITQKIKDWCDNNQDKVKEYRKITNRNCSVKIKARSKKYYQENKEHMRELNRQWNRDNPHRRKAIGAKYRAASLQASVPWANQEAIADVYKECLETTERTGVLHHVDHIVPLQSKVVCGLHNEFNLRIIPAKENLTKSNKFEV